MSYLTDRGRAQTLAQAHTSLIVSYFFTFLLFWAPLCLVVGAKKYFFGALYKNSDAQARRRRRRFFVVFLQYQSNDLSAFSSAIADTVMPKFVKKYQYPVISL